MAHAVLLQDWLTAQGNVAATVVTQQEDHYADLTPYQDVVAFIECSNIVAGIQIVFQTSPTRDNQFFLNMAAAGLAPPLGVSTVIFRYGSSATVVPLARYLRWQLSGATAAWSITFRIWLAPNIG